MQTVCCLRSYEMVFCADSADQRRNLNECSVDGSNSDGSAKCSTCAQTPYQMVSRASIVEHSDSIQHPPEHRQDHAQPGTFPQNSLRARIPLMNDQAMLKSPNRTASHRTFQPCMWTSPHQPSGSAHSMHLRGKHPTSTRPTPAVDQVLRAHATSSSRTSVTLHPFPHARLHLAHPRMLPPTLFRHGVCT
jgi:hypothetical protein